MCVCIYHSRGFQGGERKITRRGERNAGKRELTGRLRDERDPRPSLAMETGFGPLNWPLRSAAGPTRPCACADRPPPPGPAASGGGEGGREATLLPGPARFHAASRVHSPSPSPADFPAQVAAPDTRIRPVFLSRSGVRRDFFSFLFFSFLFFYFIF